MGLKVKVKTVIVKPKPPEALTPAGSRLSEAQDECT